MRIQYSLESKSLNKVYNFSPGPSKINEGVIKEVKKSIENYKDTGKSILEISHRSKDFEEILDSINQNFQSLFGLPNDFKILLLQGGATFQNSLIPFNIGLDNSIGCLVNGTWGQKTYEDFSKINNETVLFDANKQSLDTYLANDFNGFNKVNYLHITSNETIEGVQLKNFNKINHDKLIIDMSSDFGSYKFDFENINYIYAGAQKNMGIPGVTVCIVKDSFLIDDKNPSYLNLKKLTNAGSVLNTPPTFSIYVLKLVTEWMIKSGGVEYFEEKSKRQSNLLYDFIDNNSSQVNCKVKKTYRSNSNVVFSFTKEADNDNFIKLSSENGIIGVNGHRSVGGIRVSLFNSVDDDMFKYFMNFFKQFLIENK